jgi:hypothetical protein
MRPILAVRLLASLVIALSATGCGSEPAPSRESEVGELPTSRIAEGIGMDALHEARFAGDEESGCVWLADPYERLTVIWPQGFSLRWHPLRVYRPGGELFAHEGDLLQMGGGRVGTGAWKRWASESLQHCRVSDDVWLAAGVEKIEARSIP